MADQKAVKKVLMVVGAIIAGYAIYKLLEGEKPIKAIETSAKEVIMAPVTVVKKAAHLIKGSPEAKEHMRKLQAMKKSKHEANESPAQEKAEHKGSKAMTKKEYKKRFKSFGVQ